MEEYVQEHDSCLRFDKLNPFYKLLVQRESGNKNIICLFVVKATWKNPKLPKLSKQHQFVACLDSCKSL